jgi:hypothetical protein
MTLQFLSTTFIAIISAWALWSMLSPKVRDGIVGKCIYATIAMAGYAIVQRDETFFITPTVAGVTFHAALALAGVRHIFMVTYWLTVKAWICRHLNCEHCVNFGPGEAQTERRKGE